MPNDVDVDREVAEMRERLKLFALQLLSCLINAVFMALWVGMQWALDKYVVEPASLRGAGKWSLWVFQAVFSITTLVPILAYIYVDLRAIVRRAYKGIEESDGEDAQ